MKPSRLKKDEITVRRTELLALRRAGVRYDDDRILDLGYASPDAARSDVSRTLKAHRQAEAAEVEVYRQQENERLDELLEAIWPTALEGDPRAVDSALRLMDRRARLNGLDMPVKAEVTGADGGPLAVSTADPNKLEALIAATSRLDTDQPANSATSTPDESDDEEDPEG